MSDSEIIANTWSGPGILSGSETLSDDDDERLSSRQTSLKLKAHKRSKQSEVLTQGTEAAIQTSAIEDAVVKRCMRELKSSADFLKAESQCYSLRLDDFEAKHDNFEDRIFALEEALQEEVRALCDEVKTLSDEMKTLRDEAKELRNENSRKRTNATDGIEEMEEEAQKSKRRRVEIQENNNGVSIVFS